MRSTSGLERAEAGKGGVDFAEDLRIHFGGGAPRRDSLPGLIDGNLCQPAFAFDRGLTAHPGGRDRLAENVIGAITGDEDARLVGAHLTALFRDEIAVSVER